MKLKTVTLCDFNIISDMIVLNREGFYFNK